MTRRRFVFVVPRYESERPGARPIVGGAEAHCRVVVERLAARGHDVSVLTTTAASYQTWRNEFEAGEERVGPVPVTRFRTTAPRLYPLDELLKIACTRMKKGEAGLQQLRAYDESTPVVRRASAAMQRAWIRAQGPIVPALLDAVERLSADIVVFFGYLYYPTIFGLPRIRDRAVLVPLGDDEPMLYTPIVRDTLRASRAILSNVEEEAERLRAIMGADAPPIAAVAVGIDEPPAARPPSIPLPDVPYVLVLGRAGKARPVAAVFRALAEQPGLGAIELDDGTTVDASQLHLVTAGEVSPHLQGIPRVVQLGRVDDGTRWALLRGALALVSPSTTESLSLVVLEAWLAGRPVVVNRACDVTDAHVRRSSGGASIDFDDPVAGARALVNAIASRSARAEHAARGASYVRARYSWSPVIDAYETAADAIATGSDVRGALASWAGRHGSWMR